MKESYILDTHTLLWFFEGNKSLSKDAREIIKNPSNRCFISISSLWEIAIKVNLGKLQLALDFRSFVNILYENDVEILQITFEHLIKLLELEDFHRDPFDRLIISQAKHEGFSIITRDNFFQAYKDVNIIW